MDTGSPAGLWEAPALAPKQRSRLAARFRITAHWLLVAAGRTLAIVLLALAGTTAVGSGDPTLAVTLGGVLAACWSSPLTNETAVTRPCLA